MIEAINGIYENEEVQRLKKACLKNDLGSIMGEIFNVYPRINLQDCHSDGDSLTINLTGNLSTQNANYFYSFPLTYTLSTSKLNWDGVGVKSEIEMNENIVAIEESQLVRGFFQTKPNPDNIYKIPLLSHKLS